MTSTGQGLLGNNMYAYCNNNPVVLTDPSGCLPINNTRHVRLEHGGFGGNSPNTDLLMAFYGVNEPSKIPEIPDGAMIFVENITSVTLYKEFGIVEGRTIVFDENKYCEYFFAGIGWSVSMSIPFDRVVSQGYVYGLDNVNDYCGLFWGASANMLADAFGGAYASPSVYSEITGGMGFAASVGASVTWYFTAQTAWQYGRPNMVILLNPYQQSPYGSPRSI